MTRVTFIVTLVITLLFVGGCDQTELTQYYSPATQALTSGDNELRQALEAAGFSRDEIEDYGDYFVVEGDISISKQSIEEHLNSCREAESSGRQYVTSTLISQPRAWDITVRLDGSISNNPQWVSAIYSAILDAHNNYGWNSVDESSVRIRLENEQITTNDNNSLDITVYSTTSPNAPLCHQQACGSNCYGIAMFPSGGAPGYAISMNLSLTSNLSHDQRKFIFLHELGHTLGFRHSDWWKNPAEPVSGGFGACTVFGANHVPGTPTDDPLSVMNRGGAGPVPTRDLSHFDRLALSTVYPRNASTPPAAPTGLTHANPGAYGSAPILSWNSVPGAQSYDIWRCNTYGISMPGGCFTGFNKIASTTNTSFTDRSMQLVASGSSGLLNYPAYVVSATNSIGSSYQSNMITAGWARFHSPIEIHSAADTP